MYKSAPVADDAEHGYRHRLHELQIELVKFQRDLIKRCDRILVVIEGRDAAGKDGVIKQIVEHLSPRETRVVALPAPSSRQQTSWYFQRYVEHLPAAAEFVLSAAPGTTAPGSSRSWGFAPKGRRRRLSTTLRSFEGMLVNAGIRLFKYYLDIDRRSGAKSP